jgi:hypothetical protein
MKMPNESGSRLSDLEQREINDRREEERLSLNRAFKDFVEANGFKIDSDGRFRIKQWGDALAFKEIAEENGWEVELIEPNLADIKNRIFLADNFILRPVRKS